MIDEASAIRSDIQARMKWISMLCCTAILITIVGHQLSPTISIHGAVTATLFVVPLLLPLIGLLRGDRNTYKWATLCVLPYFLVGTTEAVANPAAHTWASALLGLSLLWFFSLIAYLRVSRG